MVYKSTKHNIKNGRYGHSRNWHENTATALKEWAMKPDSLEFAEFFTSIDIPESTFYDAVRDNDYMKAAHSFAKNRIGVNRHKIAVANKLNVNSVIAYPLPQYLKSWRDEDERRASLKQSDENNKSKVIIIDSLESK